MNEPHCEEIYISRNQKSEPCLNLRWSNGVLESYNIPSKASGTQIGTALRLIANRIDFAKPVPITQEELSLGDPIVERLMEVLEYWRKARESSLAKKHQS